MMKTTNRFLEVFLESTILYSKSKGFSLRGFLKVFLESTILYSKSKDFSLRGFAIEIRGDVDAGT